MNAQRTLENHRVQQQQLAALTAAAKSPRTSTPTKSTKKPRREMFCKPKPSKADKAWPLHMGFPSSDAINLTFATEKELDEGPGSIDSQDSLNFPFDYDGQVRVWDDPSKNLLLVQQETDDDDDSVVGDPMGYFVALVHELAHLSDGEDSAQSRLTGVSAILWAFKDYANDEDCDDLLQAGFVSGVLGAMQRSPDNDQVQFCGASALADMAEMHSPSGLAIIAAGGVEVLIEILRRHREHQGTLWVASLALKNLLVFDPKWSALEVNLQCIDIVARAGGIKELVKTLENCPTSYGISLAVCSCLKHLVASNKSNTARAVNAGARKAVSVTIARFHGSYDDQEEAIALMDHLTATRNCWWPAFNW